MNKQVFGPYHLCVALDARDHGRCAQSRSLGTKDVVAWCEEKNNPDLGSTDFLKLRLQVSQDFLADVKFRGEIFFLVGRSPAKTKCWSVQWSRLSVSRVSRD